jgi:DNA invertase Pin-like site-specific DNA recombinase
MRWDLPTSWMLLNGSKDDFSGRMLGAINGMMLDMLAAIARKDYEDRRRRQAEGQAKAQAAGKYQGRAENVERNTMVGRMLERGMSLDRYPNRYGMRSRHGREDCGTDAGGGSIGGW